MSRIIIPQLPHEIIIEILARLPVKPLFRLKCVCKLWLSLISNNPQFAKLHLHYAKLDTSVNRYRLFVSTFPFESIDQDSLCNGDNLVRRELSCSGIDVSPAQMSFIGTCNGLIALSWSVDLYSYSIDPHSHIFVWNPTTGDSRELPAPDSSIPGEIFSGFGYDSRLDDYKIVRGVTSTSVSSIKLEVFSLKANEWRRSSQDLHTSFSLPTYYSYTNGFLHWLVYLKNPPHEKLGIVSFDLGEEKFLEMVPVPDHVTKISGLTIQGVGDNVWVCTNSEWDGKCFEGWMMKRDGTEISWAKLYSFGRVPSLKKLSEYWIDVIWVGIDGNVVLDVNGDKLVVYNPDKKTSSEYGLNDDGYYYNPVTYMETLVSPNAI